MTSIKCSQNTATSLLCTIILYLVLSVTQRAVLAAGFQNKLQGQKCDISTKFTDCCADERQIEDNPESMNGTNHEFLGCTSNWKEVKLIRPCSRAVDEVRLPNDVQHYLRLGYEQQISYDRLLRILCCSNIVPLEGIKVYARCARDVVVNDKMTVLKNHMTKQDRFTSSQFLYSGNNITCKQSQLLFKVEEEQTCTIEADNPINKTGQCRPSVIYEIVYPNVTANLSYCFLGVSMSDGKLSRCDTLGDTSHVETFLNMLSLAARMKSTAHEFFFGQPVPLAGKMNEYVLSECFNGAFEPIDPAHRKAVFNDKDARLSFRPSKRLNSTCPKYKWSSKYFTVINASTIYVNKTDQYYRAGEFNIVVDGQKQVSALVCYDDNFVPLPIEGDSGTLQFTVTCCVLSMIFLVLHIVAQLLTSEAGETKRMLLYLSFSILATDICMILSVTETDPQGEGKMYICATIGVMLHYFSLSSLFWCNAVAFDIWRTFKQSCRRREVRNLWKYGLYAWLGPLPFIGAGLFSDMFLSYNLFTALYGFESCFINTNHALLLLFYDVGLFVMISNIFLFWLTVRALRADTTPFDKIRDNTKVSLSLFIKLAILMGVQWIFGFLASIFGIAHLWSIFSLLMLGQGGFLFFGFSSRPETWTAMKNLFCYGERSVDGRERSSAETSV